MALLEVCCFRPEGAVIAYHAGADRIELCDDREAGGTTPPFDWLATVKLQVAVPVFVMIRPRGGNFHYSNDEFLRMKASITHFKPHADGFVFGLLHDNRAVDTVRTAELVNAARPLPCTFHKAFDEAPDPFKAFEDVISTGCSGLLTSGNAPSAYAGVETLAQLVRMAQRRITVMPGGSVRASNLAVVRAYSRASIFHSSAAYGAEQPCPDEIRRLKTLLEYEGVTLPPLVKPSPPMEAQSSDEDDSEMLKSAVSIGATEGRHHTL